MKSYPYVHLRIPGRGRVTLSLPDGVRRALESGRLPATADVWLDPIGAWIPLGQHKMLARLQSISAAAKAATVALTVIPPPPPQDDLAIERFSADHLNSSKIDERREEPLVSQMAQDLHSIQAWAASL
ncbi:MAG TPA: hypothetical protein VGP80_15010 [Gemmatimonadales bacterium]|nr:hypothetical protein [Gemmatimonadales bacterium]